VQSRCCTLSKLKCARKPGESVASVSRPSMRKLRALNERVKILLTITLVLALNVHVRNEAPESSV
jgi:hypothetical protein